MNASLGRRLGAEFLGSTLLVATIVGSGIMATHLSGGNVALALLCNALATVAMLVVLILIFGPVSGAHLNPAVSLALALDRRLEWTALVPYLAAQVSGALAGVFAAHAMFGLPLVHISVTVRTGSGQWLGETIATFGLVLAILGCLANTAKSIPFAVGLYILAAYWFTSSTSFANPAVTIARSLTDTFAGIAPSDAPAFIAAQFAGALLGLVTGKLVWPEATGSVEPEPAAPPPPA